MRLLFIGTTLILSTLVGCDRKPNADPRVEPMPASTSASAANAAPKAPSNATPAAAAPSSPDCDESATYITSQKPQSGWKRVGRVVVNSDADTFVSLTIEDAAGKVLETRPLKMSRKVTGAERARIKKDVEHALLLGVCRAGGMMGSGNMGGWFRDAPPEVTMEALVPEAEDEKDDVKRLCERPADEPTNRPGMTAEEAALSEFGGAVFSPQWLTTKKWRGWHHATHEGVLDALEPSKDKKLGLELAKKKATELDELVKPLGRQSCYYANLLRALK